MTADTSTTNNNNTINNYNKSTAPCLSLSSTDGDAVRARATEQPPAAAAPKANELSENFYINNKRKHNVKIQVKLNSSGIYLRRETNENDQVLEQHIRLEDIIGSRCGTRIKKRARGGLVSCKTLQDDDQQQTTQTNINSNKTNTATTTKDTSAYLYIYAYVKRDKPLRRVQTIRILRFRTYATYEANLQAAQRWHHGIRVMKSQGREMESKHLLVLLNPKSGSGKGRELFQKQVVPVLREADVQYDLQVTTHANYARELVRTKRDLLQRYSGIVVASGDGLFHEVLNGFMERDDWRLLSRKLPIGIIPCGSGNGLAKSIAHCFNEPYEPKPILNATLACVSGNTALMDIVRVEVARGDKHAVMWSFLSVGWGLIADIDIESEKLRSIGAPRFTLWSIHRLISLRTYKGKLSYLPATHEREEFAVARECVGRRAQYPLSMKSTTAENQALREKNMPAEFFDLADVDEENDDEFVDARSLDGTSYRTHIDSWHSATSRRTAYYSIPGQSVRSSQSNTASIYSKIEAANAELEQRIPATTIPTLNMPLTEPEWQHEEGDYIMVHAAYTTHLSSDCHFAPESKLNDGIIYLMIIRGGVGRSQLLQFLLNLSSGTHLPDQPNEYIKIVPVRAFRIVPSGDDGILTVDGERVDYGSIQGEIFPGMINVMVPNCGTAATAADGSSEFSDDDFEQRQNGSGNGVSAGDNGDAGDAAD